MQEGSIFLASGGGIGGDRGAQTFFANFAKARMLLLLKTGHKTELNYAIRADKVISLARLLTEMVQWAYDEI